MGNKNKSPHLFSILFSLVVTFVISFILNSEWIYNFIGWADGWGYFGGSYDPIQMRRALPSHPLGDLLPLVLSGGLFYQLFQPFVANFLYKLITFVLSGFFIFRSVEMEFGLRTALFGTIAFLSSKDFLASIGADYTDGKVILFYLATLYFVLRACNEKIACKNRNLFLAGVSFSMTVSTALLSAVHCVALGIIYLGKCYKKQTVSDFISSFLNLLLGFLAGVLALCLIHLSYTGKFIYFANTIAKAKWMMGQVRAQPHIFLNYDWLAILLYTIVGGIFITVYDRVGKDKIKPSYYNSVAILAVACTVDFIILLLLQIFRNQGTISDPCYFVQTIPLTWTAMSGVFFSDVINRLSQRTFNWLFAAFAISAFFIFWYSTDDYRTYLALNKISSFFYFSLENGIFFLGLLVVFHLIGKKFPIFPIAAMVVFFSIINMGNYRAYSLTKNYYKTDQVSSRKQALSIYVAWIQLMDKLDPGRIAYLWYNPNTDGNYIVGMSAASHYGQQSTYNEAFPQINVRMNEMGVIRPALLVKQPVIIMTQRESLVNSAIQNLKGANIKMDCKKVEEFIVENKKYLDIYFCNCGFLNTPTPAEAYSSPKEGAGKWINFL